MRVGLVQFSWQSLEGHRWDGLVNWSRNTIRLACCLCLFYALEKHYLGCWFDGKFGINLPSSLFWNFEISKFQKMNEVNFPQISRINMWFLVNHMWQALKEHTRVRITKKKKKQSTNINKFNKHNSITPTIQQLLWLFVIIIIIIMNN